MEIFARARERLHTPLSGQQEPAFGRKKRLRIGAMGKDLEPALDAPSVRYPSNFDGICWQFSRFESGQHALEVRFGGLPCTGQ